MARVFDGLNTFRAVVVVLALALAVNGFLLYRQSTTSTAPPPFPIETAPVPPDDSTVPSEEPEESVPTSVSETPASKATVSPEEPEETAQNDTDTPEVPAPEGTGSSEEPVADASSEPAAPTLEGLGEAIRVCDGDRGECVREFVAEAVSGARYIGGRVDLNAGGAGNEEVLYFESPALEACEFVEQEYEANDGLAYDVIVVGQGSFERGLECIPVR